MPGFTAAHADDFRCVSSPFSHYEHAWSLGGMADLMADMLDAPEFVDELLDAITDFNCAILDVFAECDVKFALEVHPTEISFDLCTAERALSALDHRPEFGFNFDPAT